MDRFHDRIITKGYEQTFYEGVAEAMGYPSNKQPFRTLAERVPLQEIKQLVPYTLSNQRQNNDCSGFIIRSLWPDRFIGSSRRIIGRRTRLILSELQNTWNQHRKKFADRLMDRKEWKFGKMRPANFPYRRIAALSHLIVRHWHTGAVRRHPGMHGSRHFPQLLEKGYTKTSRNKIMNFFCLETDGLLGLALHPGREKTF